MQPSTRLLFPNTSRLRPIAEVLARAAARAADCNVEFRVNRFSRFRETFAQQRADSRTLVERVYGSCEIAHKYCCFSVNRGVFYKCPQARPLKRFTGQEPAREGIRIDTEPDLFDRLQEYLNSKQPLAACHHCLGTVGRPFDHSQVPRQHWTDNALCKYEDLVDFGRLNTLERGEQSPLTLFTPVSFDSAATPGHPESLVQIPHS